MTVIQSFHEVRIPDCFSLGSLGGPGFSTTISELASGFEQRNLNWKRVRHRFDVARTLKDKEDFAQLLAFFYCRRGRACGFRMKHWADFQFDQEQDIGDGAQHNVQLFKRYDDGSGNPYDRPLVKIVGGTYKVFYNDVQQSDVGSPGFVNINTGMLTHSAGNGVRVRVSGEFDVPVRFDVDLAQISTDDVDFHRWGQIPLLEVRLA